MSKKVQYRKGFGFLKNTPKVCSVCGNDFLVSTNNQLDNKKYCSEKCRKLSKPSQEDIFRRDGYRCAYCGKSSIEDAVKLAVDHIYPVAEGGGADLFNLITACDHCNSEKNSKILPKETILRLWERNHSLNESISQPVYDDLKAYFLTNLKQRIKPQLKTLTPER